jgi:hypothetical protein
VPRLRARERRNRKEAAFERPARLRLWLGVQNYNRQVAIDFPVQRLEIGDVIVLREQGGEVEATVAREIARSELTVRVTLRMEGRKDFVKEWPVGEMVTVVRGP